MPTAAERAAARRQAILSRGADRLSKLVQNGRGEDAAAYVHDGRHIDE
jgi:GET complex subunit GET2